MNRPDQQSFQFELAEPRTGALRQRAMSVVASEPPLSVRTEQIGRTRPGGLPVFVDVLVDDLTGNLREKGMGIQ